MTLPVGTHGHVVGPGYRAQAQIVEVAPASVRVRYAPPNGIERYDWFSTTPGARYLRRHGDTTEHALRFELEGDETCAYSLAHSFAIAAPSAGTTSNGKYRHATVRANWTSCAMAPRCCARSVGAVWIFVLRRWGWGGADPGEHAQDETGGGS